MKVQVYKKYKPSESKWLGDIPEEWSLERFGDKFLLNKEKNKTLQNNNLLSLSYGKIKRKDIKSSFGLLPESFESYQIVHAGYIILRLTDLQNDKKSLRVGLVKEKGIITSAYVGLILSKKLDPNFIFYLLYTYDIKKVFYMEGGSLRQSMKYDDIKTLPLVYPARKTQETIARYLDDRTSKIDEKIKLLKLKKIKYQEIKKNIISEVICRGLDKKIKFKASGVESLGEIPDGWAVRRLKDVASVFTGNSIADKELFLNQDDAYPYIATKDINVNTQHVKYNNGIYIPKNNAEFKVADKDSILICIEGGSAGRKIAYIDRKVCFVNKLCAIKGNNSKVIKKFLFYFFQCLLFENQFFSIMNGLIGGVSVNLIKKFDIVVPPVCDQVAIIKYLDEKTSKIDKIIETIDNEINKLSEFRKALISDVVTGKIKVV